MATNSLSFSKNALGRYESKFVSSGEKVVVQVERKKADSLTVYANLPGMTPVPILTAGTLAGKDIIFEVDVPEGVEVTVESMCEVLTAKVQG